MAVYENIYTALPRGPPHRNAVSVRVSVYVYMGGWLTNVDMGVSVGLGLI